MIADKYDVISKEDLAKLPDYKEYLKDLQKLKEYNFNGASHQDIDEKYCELATIFPYVSINQNPEIFNKHTFYRVRLNIDTVKEDINLIQTHSYPMPFFCQSNGRANIKGKSVFYCSDEVGAALFECKPQKGDEGFLSIWKPIASRPIKFGVLTSTDISTNNNWYKLTSDILDMVKEFYKEETPDRHKHFIELYKFIGERFVNEGSPYPLTSWLSNKLIYEEDGIDLILYPSIATEQVFCNMAIHPNTAHTQMELDKIIRFKVNSVNGSKIGYSPGDVGEPIGTNIIWRPSKASEKEFMKLL